MFLKKVDLEFFFQNFEIQQNLLFKQFVKIKKKVYFQRAPTKINRSIFNLNDIQCCEKVQIYKELKVFYLCKKVI